MIILDWLSGILLALGVFFGLTGAVGLFRFPDFFTRIHAASITDSMCAIMIVAGLVLLAEHWVTAVKLLFILMFLLVTSPTASHALAKAARRGGVLTIPEKSGATPQDSKENT